MKNKKLLDITVTGIFTSLYIVLTLFVQFPLAENISIDLGYIVLGIGLMFFKPWQNAIIGGVGCVAKCLSLTGSFPFAWFPAQIILAFIATIVCQSNLKTIIKYLIVSILVFVCIAGIKTTITTFITATPFIVNVVPNLFATVADIISICIGLFVSKFVKNPYEK